MPRGGSKVHVKISRSWKTMLLRIPMKTHQRATLYHFLRSLTFLVLSLAWTDKQIAASSVESPGVCLSVGPVCTTLCMPRGMLCIAGSCQLWDATNWISYPLSTIDAFFFLLPGQEHANVGGWNWTGENFYTEFQSFFLTHSSIHLFTK